VKLPALGVEDVTLTVVANFALTGTLQTGATATNDYPGVDFTWADTAWSDVEVLEADGDHTRPFVLLLAGSAATPPGGSLQLVSGVNYLWVKITSGSEVIIRPAGRVTAL
jgi:hypothetical protein